MVKTGSFTTTPDLKPAAAIVYPIGKSVKGILYDMGTRAALLSTKRRVDFVSFSHAVSLSIQRSPFPLSVCFFFVSYFTFSNLIFLNEENCSLISKISIVEAA